MGFYFFKKYEVLIFKQSFNISIQPNIYLNKISILPSGNFIALTDENNFFYYLSNNFNVIKKIIIDEYLNEISIYNKTDKSDTFCLYNEEIIKIYSLINSNIKPLTTILNFKNIKKVEFFQTNKLIVYNNAIFYILKEVSEQYQIQLVLNHFYHSIFNINEFHKLFCIANHKSIILFNYKHQIFKINKIIPLKFIFGVDEPYKIVNINKNKIIVIFKPGSIGHNGYPGDYQFKHISIPDGKIINELKIRYNMSECHFFKNKEIFIIIIDFFGINLYDINNLNYIETIKINNFRFFPGYYNSFTLNENGIGIYIKDKNTIHIFNFSNNEGNLLS